eukprot:284815987_3
MLRPGQRRAGRSHMRFRHRTAVTDTQSYIRVYLFTLGLYTIEESFPRVLVRRPVACCKGLPGLLRTTLYPCIMVDLYSVPSVDRGNSLSVGIMNTRFIISVPVPYRHACLPKHCCRGGSPNCLATVLGRIRCYS